MSQSLSLPLSQFPFLNKDSRSKCGGVCSGSVPGGPQEAWLVGPGYTLGLSRSPKRPTLTTLACPAPAAFLKGLSDKQREEHYFCKDFIKLKKIPTWKETAKGTPYSLIFHCFLVSWIGVT